MTRFIRVIGILLFTLCCGSVSAFYFKQYNTSNSLASNNVYFVYRDSKGYLWFLTDKGVSKFDGAEFRNFTVLDGLGDNEVFKAFEDRKGRLWLFTHDGSPCYISNDRVYNTVNDSLLKRLPVLPFINEIYEDEHASLYIGYENGKIIKVTDSNIKWICKKSIAGRPLTSIYKTNGIIHIYSSFAITYLKNDSVIRSDSVAPNLSVFQDSSLIITDEKGIKIYRNDTLVWKLDDKGLVKRTIIRPYVDNDKNLFCCTNNGLVIINLKSGKRWRLFPNITTTCVCKDVAGNFWVSTLHHGVYFINKNLDGIKSINDISLYDLIYTRNGQIFFKKENEIYVLPKNNPLKIIKLAVPFKNAYDPLYVNDSLFIYSDPQRSVTYYYDRIGKKVHIFSKYLRFIFPYAHSGFWMVGFDWLLNGAIDEHEVRIKNEINTPDNRFAMPVIDNNSNMYCMKKNALYRYSGYTIQPEKIDSFPAGMAIINLNYSNGKLLLTTNKQETIIYKIPENYKKQIVKATDTLVFDTYHLKNGSDLLFTNKGYFITDSSRSGEDYFSHLRTAIFPFRQKDLLFILPVDNEIICNVDGTLFAFKQELLNTIPDTPALFIRKIIAEDKACTSGNITLYNSSGCDLKLELASLYFSGNPCIFEYRIIRNGTPGMWYAQQSNNLNILLTKWGRYQVECRAKAGMAVSKSQTVVLDIIPPFYYTSAFYICIAVSVIIILLYALHRYNRKRKKAFESELNYLQLENKAINSLINPHFIFNSINNIQGLISIGSKETANNYLATLSQMIRQNMENLQHNFISVEKELQLIRNYIHLQNLRFGDKITLEIYGDTHAITGIAIPPLLIHTFIENSIVHGIRTFVNRYKIMVELDLSSDDYLIIKVVDNGVGINHRKRKTYISDDKTSMGIEFTKRRLQRLSAFYKVDYSLNINDLSDMDKKSSGTEVIIIVYANFWKLRN